MVVRCRPMSSKETADSRLKVVEMDKKRGSVRARSASLSLSHLTERCVRCGRWSCTRKPQQMASRQRRSPSTRSTMTRRSRR